MTEITGDFLKSSGKGRGIKVSVDLGKRVEVGVEGKKAFGTVVVRRADRERKGGRFFVKHTIDRDMVVEDVIKKYCWLKENGLPVVPMLRYDSKTNSLLMTDLTEGGKKIVTDRHHPLIEYGISPDHISNWIEIRQNVNQIAVQAYDDGEGMELDDDNYSIVLEKKVRVTRGRCFWLILDTGRIS